MKKEYWPIVVGVALPVVFIGILAGAIFIPTLSINPKYNFLYSVQEYYETYANEYKVVDGRIVLDPVVVSAAYRDEIKEIKPLFLYDVQNNTVREITYEDARGLLLTPGPSSPDGYTIQYQSGEYGIFEFFAGGNTHSGFYIFKGGNAKKKLPTLDYNRGFKLIGWVQN